MAIPPVEKPMSTSRLPQTDSIQELANFWDTHDVTEFEAELEEVSQRVFERDTGITIHLPADDVGAVRALARSRGVGDSELLREWVLERLHAT
jgi:predicted phosphatase